MSQKLGAFESVFTRAEKAFIWYIKRKENKREGRSQSEDEKSSSWTIKNELMFSKIAFPLPDCRTVALASSCGGFAMMDSLSPSGHQVITKLSPREGGHRSLFSSSGEERGKYDWKGLRVKDKDKELLTEYHHKQSRLRVRVVPVFYCLLLTDESNQNCKAS